MTDPVAAPDVAQALPPDDPQRSLTIANSGPATHSSCIALAGDIYTILISGKQTAGRYCLIDMRVPPGGGPPPHRHDFEEMFTLLEGSVEFTFRGATHLVHAGDTVNIPANAPHFFRNASDQPVRMLCMCTPAGQEDYFALVGDPVASPGATPPTLSDEEKRARQKKAAALALQYRTEFIKH